MTFYEKLSKNLPFETEMSFSPVFDNKGPCSKKTGVACEGTMESLLQNLRILKWALTFKKGD
jgi:hypothetical protein